MDPKAIEGTSGNHSFLVFGSPGRRVGALAGALAVGAAILYALYLRTLGPFAPHAHIPWWALMIGFGMIETFAIHLQFRREAHSISMSEIPLAIGVFFLSPFYLLLARIIGSGSGLFLGRGQRGLRLVFNLSYFAFESTVAVTVFRFLSRDAATDLFGPKAWLAAFITIVVVDLLGGLLITVAMWLHDGRIRREVLGEVMVTGTVAALLNTCLSLIAVTTLASNIQAAWLLIAMLGVVLVAYRGYAKLHQRFADLEQLQDFASVLTRSPDAVDGMRRMLAQTRELLRAEIAELWIVSRDDGAATIISLQADEGEATVRRSSALALPLGWAHMIETGEPRLAPRGSEDPLLAALAVQDIIVVPLRDDRGVSGALTVANRMGEVSTFAPADLRLLETLAGHAATSLQNGRLIEKLQLEAAEKEHQATHDALTGLPNRTLFRTALDRALAAATIDKSLAVMLMDLDRFKEINDTLGHHNGDTLLREVGSRLTNMLPPDVTIARLGGDEFGILVRDVASVEAVLERASEIISSLERPFEVDHLTLEIGASLGVALAPEHGSEADVVLRRADVAMYAAKNAGRGICVYDPAEDQYSPKRLALLGEVRRGIDREELVLHYQPKADLRTERIVGAEALLRWKHPEHGFIPPDDFIPAVEQTGLIHALTSYVVRQALEQVAAWHSQDIRLGVAVNISTRNLLDAALPAMIHRLLLETGIAPEWLTLEITETSIMADTARTLTVLHQISDIGVRIAVDDFGTGYSSLAYLKRLPVTEVKIDKSFVMNMRSDPNDAAIVNSIVDLGANLGLKIVAEGVEDIETWRELSRIGCDTAQGYYLSRPLPAAQFVRWLAGRPSQPAAEASVRALRPA